jgi:hypothetical protein
MRRWSLSKFRPQFTRPADGQLHPPNVSSAPDPLPPETTRAFAETVLWCSRQNLRTSSDDREFLRNTALLKKRIYKELDFAALSPLSSQLRSPGLQPEVSMEESYSRREECEASFAKVVALRSQLLAAAGAFDPNIVLSQKSGRLLIYEPWENVSDGASQVASLGFFDPNDAPPWDTWIHYGDGRLVCWVPKLLIKLAQDGIDANCVQCIQWADELAQ